MMNTVINDSKAKTIHGLCKSHTNRSDKDLYRLCPSKLNKQELEDLYFTLLQTNVQLKKTINEQQDQMKVLSTKLQRLAAQKPTVGSRSCCANKAVINEQKETIADLKRTNERLSERIRLLNMRLCSAKQFLRRSSSQTTQCQKCSLTSNTSMKNLSMSELYTKRSDANQRIEAVSYGNLDKKNAPTKLLGIVSTQTENVSTDESCEQNKCRTTIDDLKQKIVNLEEELSKTHVQYQDSLQKLDAEMMSLKIEHARMRSKRNEAEQQILVRQEETRDLVEKLRRSELLLDDLSAQLMVERGKASELEMQIKAAEISSRVAKALERQMKSATLLLSNSSASVTNDSLSKGNKNSDDSGYTDNFKNQNDNNGSYNCDSNILNQIAIFQQELKILKLSMKSDQHQGKSGPALKPPGPQGYTDKEISFKLESFKTINKDDSPPSTSRPQVDLIYPTEPKNDPNIETVTDTQIEQCTKDTLQIPVPLKRSKIPHLIKNAIEIPLEKITRSDEDDIDNTEISKIQQAKTGENLIKKDYENTNRSSDNNLNSSQNVEVDCANAIKNRRNSSVNSEEGKSPEDDSPKTNSKTSQKDFQNIDTKAKIDSQTNQDISTGNKRTKRSSNEKIVDEYQKLGENDEQTYINPEFNGKDIKRPKNEFVRTVSYVIENKPARKLTKYASVNVDSDDIRQETYSIERRPPQPLATSSPNQGTYVLSNATTSPDNTDCEISSLTDLPNELDAVAALACLSPGEQRPSLSESGAASHCGSLSEGELPCTEVRRLSYAEVDVKNDIPASIRSEAADMEETLLAIKEELKRCRLLMDNGVVTFPLTYYPDYTLPLN